MSSPRVFFVTGTDTGVGKTAVAAGLLRAAGRAGRSTLAIKPVAAGCELEQGRLVNDDARILMQEASLVVDYDDVNPVALEAAIAPHIAAARAGIGLSADGLADACRSLLDRGADWTVVEGAGGWLVPLNGDETLADLCVALGAEVILVVGMRLGCLNHALLSVADIERRGLSLAGWVASEIEAGMPELEANLETLGHWIAAPCLGRVPHVVGGGPAVVEAAARSLALGRLEAEPAG